MKKLVGALLAAAMVLSLAACGGQNGSVGSGDADVGSGSPVTPASPDEFDWSAMDPISIKFAHGYAGGELAVELADKWMAMVTEKTEGAIQWDYHPGGSLGSITELVEQTDLGAIDCTLSDTSQLENYSDAFAILFYPFLIQSYEHQVAVLNSPIMDKFTALLENESNLHVIGYYVNGVRNICSKTPITSLADCKGVIMRTPEIQVYKDVATLLGMSPTTISYSEMYTALNTGVCEAVECPNNSLYPGGYHQVGGYILKSGHMYSSCAIEFNTNVWNSYPAEVQAVLKECFDSLTEEHAQKVIAADEEYYRLYEEDGAVVTEWDNPSEPASVCEDYWTTSAEGLGQDAIEIVNEIVALRS